MRIGRILIVCMTAFGLTAHAQSYQSSTETRKGWFSIAAQFGLGDSRFLNTDGNYSYYKTQNYGLGLDVLLWDAGAGDIRLFVQHEAGSGTSHSDTQYKLTSSETVAGIKIFAGNYMYLAGGMGAGQTTLENSSSYLRLGYDLVQASIGLEFALTSSFFAGIELDYKNAPLRKARNTSLEQNSYYESVGAYLRLIWSPPSVTVNNSYRSK